MEPNSLPAPIRSIVESFQRQKQAWEEERKRLLFDNSELKARVAELEAHVATQNKTNRDLTRKVSALEYGLRNEREECSKLQELIKYIESQQAQAQAQRESLSNSGIGGGNKGIPSLIKEVLKPRNLVLKQYYYRTHPAFNDGWFEAHLLSLRNPMSKMKAGRTAAPGLHLQNSKDGRKQHSAHLRSVSQSEQQPQQPSQAQAQAQAQSQSQSQSQSSLATQVQQQVQGDPGEAPLASSDSVDPALGGAPATTATDAPAATATAAPSSSSPKARLNSDPPKLGSDTATSKNSNPGNVSAAPSSPPPSSPPTSAPPATRQVSTDPTAIAPALHRKESSSDHMSLSRTRSGTANKPKVSVSQPPLPTADLVGLTEPKPYAQMKPRLALRSHLDVVRSVHFHPDLPLLLSGGDDGTAKLWALGTALHPSNAKKKFKGIEPLHTFRGHRGIVTCAKIHSGGGSGGSGGSNGSFCVTAGVDGKVILWDLPPLNRDPYSTFGSGSLFKRTELRTGGGGGGGGAVWDVMIGGGGGTPPILFTAHSNNTVNIFQSDGQLVRSVSTRSSPASLALPTTSSSNHLLIALVDGTLELVDIETGSRVHSMVDTSPGGDSRITKVVASNVHNLAVTAHTDTCIRFFDPRAASCLGGMRAHRDMVSSLDLHPSSSYLVTASPHGVRCWDLFQKKIVQDMDPHQTHRRKLHEGVTSVVFHRSLPFLASGGADTVVKVYE